MCIACTNLREMTFHLFLKNSESAGQVNQILNHVVIPLLLMKLFRCFQKSLTHFLITHRQHREIKLYHFRYYWLIY